MASIRPFPNIPPSSRSYTPGTYAQTEFVAQNGAKSVIRYGNKQVDAKLTLNFTNIIDFDVNKILDLYKEVNSNYDFINFRASGALDGVISGTLKDNMAETDTDPSFITRLRYRFDGPPTVTSVKRNRSNVQCKFVACLDGD